MEIDVSQRVFDSPFFQFDLRARSSSVGSNTPSPSHFNFTSEASRKRAQSVNDKKMTGAAIN